MPRLVVLFVLSAASSHCPDLKLIHYISFWTLLNALIIYPNFPNRGSITACFANNLYLKESEMTILSDVKALGQQIWLDNLSRSLVQSGELAKMLKQGVCGVTSNPAIFQKAFAGDALYADEVAALKQQDLSPKQRYETMAIADVQAACDVCLAEHESTGGKTGFVSREIGRALCRERV